MSCSGLHCAGCGGGSAAPVLALTALLGVDWVVTHLVEVIAVSAASGILAVAAVVALTRWADRRDAARDAAWRARHARAVPETVRAVVVGRGADKHLVSHDPVPERPALGFRDLHIHLDGMPDAAQAAIIRQALNAGRTDQP